MSAKKPPVHHACGQPLDVVRRFFIRQDTTFVWNPSEFSEYLSDNSHAEMQMRLIYRHLMCEQQLDPSEVKALQKRTGKI